ncbi:MAG: RNA-directed DNA polymerase [Gammaproteobacteria bacterium]|nr:RNA-directed DNA polymerase [Gammaproteobacteria bacterium]
MLQKINRVFFRNIDYPDYLQGSLAGRDPATNALVHRDSRLLVSEDILKFFDHIDSDRVFSIWRNCFQFDEESSRLLTELTTKDGMVLQGAPTSSYIGNLAFWDVEGIVVDKLRRRGYRYSRYVDDVAFSSSEKLTQEDVAWAIGQLYAMFGSRGFKPQRAKHELQTSADRIQVMRFGVNRAPSLSRKERSSIRGHLHKLEVLAKKGEFTPEFYASFNSFKGRLSRLKRMHTKDAAELKPRLDQLRRLIEQGPRQALASVCPSVMETLPKTRLCTSAEPSDVNSVPW